MGGLDVDGMVVGASVGTGVGVEVLRAFIRSFRTGMEDIWNESGGRLVKMVVKM